MALWALVSIAVGLTPERYRKARFYGILVGIADRLSFLVHSDSPGTLKLPGLASAVVPGADHFIEAAKLAEVAVKAGEGSHG